MKLILAIMLFLSLSGCSQTAVNQNTPAKEAAQITPTQKEVKIPIQGGQQIDSTVLSSVENGMPFYAAVFKTPIAGTDGNLYLVSLTMLETFFGKGRGLIDLKEGKIETYPAGKFLCWQITNPEQKFCISQSRVSDTDQRFNGVVFFVK
jgi:hypothetical protein